MAVSVDSHALPTTVSSSQTKTIAVDVCVLMFADVKRGRHKVMMSYITGTNN